MMFFFVFGALRQTSRPNDINSDQKNIIFDQHGIQNCIKIGLGVPPRRVREPSRKNDIQGYGLALQTATFFDPQNPKMELDKWIRSFFGHKSRKNAHLKIVANFDAEKDVKHMSKGCKMMSKLMQCSIRNS